MTIRLKAPRHLKCECGGIYDVIVEMNKINKLTRKQNNVRKCSSCKNIRDIGLLLQEDLDHTNFELSGICPNGKFNIGKGVWVSS